MAAKDNEQKPRKRAARLESEQRIQTAELFLARGASTTQIVSLLMQQWNISERQAYRYIEIAKDSLKMLGQQSMADQAGLLMRRTDLLFQQALANKDLALASKIAGQQMNFVISQEKYKGGTSDTVSHSSGISADDMAALLAELGKDRSFG